MDQRLAFSKHDPAIFEAPPELGAPASAAAAVRVFVAVAESVAGASAPIAASGPRRPFVSPGSDAPYLAVAGDSAVPCPAAQPTFAALSGISDPASDSPCWVERDAPPAVDLSHGLPDALPVIQGGAHHRHDFLRDAQRHWVEYFDLVFRSSFQFQPLPHRRVAWRGLCLGP